MNFNLTSDMEPNSMVGFRFHPTDHELVYNYLRKKFDGLIIDRNVINELNIYNYEPSDLPDYSRRSEDDTFYFFCARNYMSPKSQRSQRRTDAGYWKPTGKARVVKHKITKKKIGTKRTLVFHSGRPKGIRTGWVMHEYEYTDNRSKDETTLISNQGEFVLCKIKKKSVSKGRKSDSNLNTREACRLMALTGSNKSDKSSDFVNGNENQILANAEDVNNAACMVASADQVEPGSDFAHQNQNLMNMDSVLPRGTTEEGASCFNTSPSEETVSATHWNEDSHPMLFDLGIHIPDSSPDTYVYLSDIEDQLAWASQLIGSKENQSPDHELGDYYGLFNLEDDVF